MSYTELQLANKALAKIGGAGDQLQGNAFLPDLAGSDNVTTFVVAALPEIRKKVIIDLALRDCPFREATKYADLGTDLISLDVAISGIAVGAGPTYTVTVTTSEAHGLLTDDYVRLYDIDGTGGIEAGLNNQVKKVTVTTTTAFTLQATTGAAAWAHTADTGVVTITPQIGDYEYAFDLPSTCIAVVKMLDETFNSDGKRQEYKFETILNVDDTGQLLITNDYSNYDGNSAFIQYCIDQSNPNLFSQALIECLACLLAAELSPICGKDIKTRQQMLMEYETIAIPEAQAFNQSQFNNYAKSPVDYLGGRSKTLS